MKTLSLFGCCLTLSLVALITLTSACTPKTASLVVGPTSLQDRYNTLDQVVRNLPNVQVLGDAVIYRGPSSLTSEQEMKFLVGEVIISSLAQTEALYPLNSVRAVRVVPPVDAISRYGPRGSAGLIELILVD